MLNCKLAGQNLAEFDSKSEFGLNVLRPKESQLNKLSKGTFSKGPLRDVSSRSALTKCPY